jgi:anti-sigma regulatory factor (Ser/Thr protein kinase)
MTITTSAQYEIRSIFPATLEAVDEFVARTRGVWNQGAERSRSNFISELLLREALTNAVVHGSLRESRKSVKCALRVRDQKLFFLVRDCGCGFNWHEESKKQVDPDDSGGRGISILISYASRIRFNKFGNQVAIARDFGMRQEK